MYTFSRTVTAIQSAGRVSPLRGGSLSIGRVRRIRETGVGGAWSVEGLDVSRRRERRRVVQLVVCRGADGDGRSPCG